MSIPISEISAVILAGGMARRMGGVDKGLQLLDGQPMVQHVLHRVRPQVASVLINANRHLEQYQHFEVPLCSDTISGYAGPLAGMHAALLQINTPYLLSVPCDAPQLPNDLVARLADALSQHNADAAVAVTGTGAQRQRHPVFVLLKSALLPLLEKYLDQNGRKVDQWLGSIHCVDVPFDDEAAFTNVNTMEEMDALTTQVKQRVASNSGRDT